MAAFPTPRRLAPAPTAGRRRASGRGAAARLAVVRLAVALFVLAAALAAPGPAAAQYFGKNKVQYDDFDFRTMKTDRFEVYYYPEEKQAVEDAARMAERWYQRHSRTFLRDFNERKPLIFYANDADFQQTNVIRGRLGQGTGGVTESLKERVVMPLTGSYAETDHVLGHELVHSFQYDIALRGDMPGFSLRRLPLWLVEGMAEYLSVGREDPHTAMWLRDAALRGDLPTIEQMTRDMYTYFPYRYGQAYMAYIGGKYGDAAVTNLYKLSGQTGVDSAFVYALGISTDSLSAEWQAAVRDTYLEEASARTPVDSVGRAVIGTPGEKRQLNISPALSPDGRYVAFIARRNLFTTNLFVADAETGEIVQELEGTRSNPHFDALRFINSAGTWSPDGRRFAFVTFVDGDNEITIFDVTTGEIVRRTAVAGVGAIHNLAWSPDGRTIAFAGLDGGISDLYLLDLETDQARQLTNDRYADLQPAWSPNGRTLAFTTDRGPDGTSFEALKWGAYRIGLIDVQTRDIRTVRPFARGMHHNPQFSPDGRSLYFISDQDGYKDVYRTEVESGTLFRVTRLQTGVSGITALSPALSVAGQSGRMMFSVYANSGYAIVGLEGDETGGTPLADSLEGTPVASLLPPPVDAADGQVGSYLNDPLTGLPEAQGFEDGPASRRLRLDYVAPPQVGAGYATGFGTQIYGGVGFFFSDMLGNQNLDVFLQANGTVKDIGGGAFYTNRASRFNYGAGASHIPYLYGRPFAGDFNGDGFVDYLQLLQRIYRTQGGVQGSYPLSQTRRFELSLAGTRYAFDYDARIFDFGGVRDIDPARLGFREPASLYLGQVGLAYVGDFSNNGFVSPLQGGRYRVQVTPHFGTANFLSVLVDYRRYFFAEPVTFAIRGLHLGNYADDVSGGDLLGNDFDADIFLRESLGDPYQLGFVRGYALSSIFEEPRCRFQGDCETDRLFGTRIAMASAEVRVPLFGTDALGLINFPYLPTEIGLFTDAGVAWTNQDFGSLRFETDVPELFIEGVAGRRSPARPVVSSGVSARINMLGALVFELFYARTFQRARDWDFGVVLRPGW
jgi:hypothetical protein